MIVYEIDKSLQIKSKHVKNLYSNF